IGPVQPRLLDRLDHPDLLRPHPPPVPLDPPSQIDGTSNVAQLQIKLVERIQRRIKASKRRLSTRIGERQSHTRTIRRGYDSQAVPARLILLRRNSCSPRSPRTATVS